MGIKKGPLGYVRFIVEGAMPTDKIAHFEEVINFRRFSPLKPEGEDIFTSGFMPLQNPYLESDLITHHDFLFGERLVLAYREDSIVYPKPYMRALMEKRLAEEKEKRPDTPNAVLKEAVTASVIAEFRQRIFPKSKVVEIVWDFSRGELRFLGRGQTLIDRFTETFEQTFEMKLHLMTAGFKATRCELSLSERSALETLTPEAIFEETFRHEVL